MLYSWHDFFLLIHSEAQTLPLLEAFGGTGRRFFDRAELAKAVLGQHMAYIAINIRLI